MLHPDALAQTMPMLLKGMAGIFLLIGVIVLATELLKRLTKD